MRRHAAHRPVVGDDVAAVVAPQVEPGALELGIIFALDPFARGARVMLIDQEVIVHPNQEFGGIARLLLGVAQQSARHHQIAGEDRRAALADKAFAQNQRLDAAPTQLERGEGSGRATADHDRFGNQLTHTFKSRDDGA